MGINGLWNVSWILLLARELLADTSHLQIIKHAKEVQFLADVAVQLGVEHEAGVRGLRLGIDAR